MKRKVLLSILSCALAGSVLAGCATGHDAPAQDTDRQITGEPTATPEPTKAEEEVVVEEEQEPEESKEPLEPAEFAKDSTDPVQILSYLGEGDNFIYAPESFKTAMYMYGQMLPDSAAKEQIDILTAGRDYLKYRNTSTYKLVNRIWIDSEKDYDLTAYPTLLNLTYAVPMSDPSSTKIKDDYVAEQTEHFIESTPVQFTPDMVMDVMNIAYFHAVWDADVNPMEVMPWKIEFKDYDDKMTGLEVFGNYGERTYMESDTAYAVKLFYACEDDEVANSMYVILPKEGNKTTDIKLSDFLDGGADTTEWHTANVNLQMPRIDLKCQWTMNPTDDELMHLFGLDAFGSQGINEEIYADGNGQIPGVSQVVRIKSDEEGTTAAAVTEVFVTNSAIDEDPLPNFDFICNRPFIYVIFDETNQDIAFIGQYLKAE